MHRSLSFLTGIALLVSTGLASTAANAHCLSPTDETTFELQGLKSALEVLTLSCKMDDRYNAFVRKFQPRLGQDERDFASYFKRTYGSSAQREQDAYITLLANSHASESIKQGTDYCARNAMIFDELSALPNDKDLGPYVAGKDVLPVDADGCPGPTRAEPTVRRIVATTRKTVHH